MTDSSSPWGNGSNPNRRAPDESSIRRASDDPEFAQFVESLSVFDEPPEQQPLVQIVIEQPRRRTSLSQVILWWVIAIVIIVLIV